MQLMEIILLKTATLCRPDVYKMRFYVQPLRWVSAAILALGLVSGITIEADWHVLTAFIDPFFRAWCDALARVG